MHFTKNSIFEEEHNYPPLVPELMLIKSLTYAPNRVIGVSFTGFTKTSIALWYHSRILGGCATAYIAVVGLWLSHHYIKTNIISSFKMFIKCSTVSNLYKTSLPSYATNHIFLLSHLKFDRGGRLLQSAAREYGNNVCKRLFLFFILSPFVQKYVTISSVFIAIIWFEIAWK